MSALALGEKIRVVIADDHTLVRESLVAAMVASGRIEVVGQAAHGQDALELCCALVPHVAVLDISMPRLNGLEVVSRLGQLLPATRCLVLTMHEDEEYLLQAVRAGAGGFLLKDSPMRELMQAVEALAAGRAYFSAEATRVLSAQLKGPGRAPDDPYGSLTAREREVFHLLIEGRSTKEIARSLGISAKTAENHRSRVLAKLDARKTADVILYAVRRGLIG